MKSFNEITDNTQRKQAQANAIEDQKHLFARMAQMMAEERGEVLSYEEALKL